MKTASFAAASILALALGPLAQVRETRSDVKVQPTSDSNIAISPDGEKLVASASPDGKFRLWLYTLATGAKKVLEGTDDIGIVSLCWSPDSKSIAYFGSSQLKRIDIETGEIKVIVPGVSRGRGCSWGRDGTILLGVGTSTQIARVPDSGGALQAATPRGTLTASSPYFLPDNRHFLYYVLGEGVYVAELGGTEPKFLFSSDSAALYSRTGHLLFVRQKTLYAQGFDTDSLTLSKEPPFKVADDVPVSVFRPAVSLSAAGDLVFRTGPDGGLRQFKFFDRSGKELGKVGAPLGIAGSPPRLSPDERFLVMDRAPAGRTDVWMMELATGKVSSLTEIPGLNLFPTWNTDGCCIYFTSNQSGVFELYERPASANGKEKLVLATPRITRQPKDASPDGRFLLYRTGTGREIFAIQLDGNPRGEFPVINGTGLVDNPRFSPNGRWVVYQITEAGKTDIYVQQFPSGRRIRVTTNGGVHPQWRNDGKEIFYIGTDGKITAIGFEADADDQNAQVGTPTPLFAPALLGNPFDESAVPQYMVLRDGRFLIATAVEIVSPITLIRHWQAKP